MRMKSGLSASIVRVPRAADPDRATLSSEGVFPGRELYFFDPSGNRLELRDPTWHAGMPEPTFEERADL